MINNRCTTLGSYQTTGTKSVFDDCPRSKYRTMEWFKLV